MCRLVDIQLESEKANQAHSSGSITNTESVVYSQPTPSRPHESSGLNQGDEEDRSESFLHFRRGTIRSFRLPIIEETILQLASEPESGNRQTTIF